jgi:hypothetical protein
MLDVELYGRLGALVAWFDVPLLMLVLPLVSALTHETEIHVRARLDVPEHELFASLQCGKN